MAEFEISKILARNCILGKANPELMQSMITDDSLCLKKFNSGEEICSSKTENHCVGIIVCGSATVLPQSEGGNAMLKTLTADDMFGISNLYADTLPFPSVITCASPCSVLFINRDAFKSVIDSDRAALEAYLSVLNNKIVYLNRKISTLTAGSAEKRLAMYLAENECDGIFVPSISMSAISNMLNIGRASLYRALDTLAASGLIVKEGKKISIPDKNALLNF